MPIVPKRYVVPPGKTLSEARRLVSGNFKRGVSFEEDYPSRKVSERNLVIFLVFGLWKIGGCFRPKKAFLKRTLLSKKNKTLKSRLKIHMRIIHHLQVRYDFT